MIGIYWIGPGLGAIVAVLFYRFIKMLEYETANPGADADHSPQQRYENGPTGRDNDAAV